MSDTPGWETAGWEPPGPATPGAEVPTAQTPRADTPRAEMPRAETPRAEDAPTGPQPVASGAPQPRVSAQEPRDADHWWRVEEDPHVWAPPGPSRVAGGGPRTEPVPPVPPPPKTDQRWNPWMIIGACVLAFVVAFAGVGLVKYANDHGNGRPTLSDQVTPSQATTPSTQPPSTPSTEVPGGSGGSGGSSGNAAADKVTPAVVNINTNSAILGGSGAGTGMLLTSSGEVLTNNHVVSGASNIRVEVPSTGRTYGATVVGTDATDDVAVIQLQGASGLPTIMRGNSAAVKVGDSVTAVGNAGGQGGAPTVATGSVQALDQSITVGDPATGVQESLSGLIQTDAQLQPGDSGGPLVDQSGAVIGMDTAASVGGRRFQTVPAEGYAIPINSALDIAAKIEAGQAGANIQIGPPAFLGVVIVSPSQSDGGFGGPVTPSTNGASVTQVQPGTPAAKAGVQAGDVITGLGGKTVDSPTTLKNVLKTYRPGDKVSIRWVDSSGQQHSATITLAAGPPA